MTTATANAAKLPTSLGEMAAHWRQARRLYGVYAAIYTQYGLSPLCPDLETPVDRNEVASIERIWKWFEEADTNVQVWHIRQLFQTSHFGTEENLRTLALRFLELTERGAHRDKLDFLLVQYFTQRAPLTLHDRDDFDLEIVAEVLEPVLGEAVPHAPSWARPLEDALTRLRDCHSLTELFSQKIIETGRHVKESAGEMFFGTAALLAMTRFNFLVRRAFFRLMQAEINAIRASVRELVRRGVAAVDCTAAGLAGDESAAGILRYCQEWKTPFRAAYDVGRPVLPLVRLREAVEAALRAAAATRPEPAAPAEPPAAVPVVEESTAAPVPEAEFHVAPPQPAHEPTHFESPRLEPEPIVPAAAAPDTGDVSAELIAKLLANVRSPAEEMAERHRSGASTLSADTAASSPAPIAEPAPHVPSAKPPIAAFKPRTASQPAPPVAMPTVESCLEEIAPQLLEGKHSASVTRLTCGGSKLLISSWEAAAFVRGGDETSDALQRAVAARSLLVQAMDRLQKSGDGSWLEPAMTLARQEMAMVQNQVVRAKDQKDIDAAVNLAATCTRLLSLIQDASKLGA